jgi:hypothetical protein
MRKIPSIFAYVDLNPSRRFTKETFIANKVKIIVVFLGVKYLKKLRLNISA